MKNKKISIIIPVYNEADNIGNLVSEIRSLYTDFEIIVVNDGSLDDTARVAQDAGATVYNHPYNIGNGAAVKSGIRIASGDILVFMDGDRSDDPQQLPSVVAPVLANQADLVIGSRIHGQLSKGAMPVHGRLGNRLIVCILRLLYQANITDIGSFRAIRSQTLFDLQMEQMTYGWPIEMVVKAARRNLRIQSVPIHYRKRIGKSKVTGTVRGTILATYYMFLVPLKYLFRKV